MEQGSQSPPGSPRADPVAHSAKLLGIDEVAEDCGFVQPSLVKKLLSDDVSAIDCLEQIVQARAGDDGTTAGELESGGDPEVLGPW
eukprot:CAMPEP_0119151210 /NCGR_PEP_ID=MMETSP1310-20130426/46015_1 /TAXON_ID=464262 /ORGANISM="Genus nov. species nov., Strain RCC2339" /LENGTH=85 /DNA_ID=CAMNT_0007143467 /DNA_START=131 /DNA_END=385 /DNA_ORIENTATION=-